MKLIKLNKQYTTRTAWGLDIGAHVLKAVKITKRQNELFVEDVGIIKYSSIPSTSNSLQSSYISDAIKAFLEKYNVSRKDNILVSVPGQLVLSRFFSVPVVNKKQLKNIIGYEVKQQIPFDVKDIVWNYHQINKKYSGTENIEIGLFASKRATLDNILSNITPFHLKLSALQVTPLAICNFVCYDRQVDGPVLIINVETDNTDLIIIDGMNYWLRSIPHYLVDLELVKEIQRSIEYHKSLNKDTINIKAVLLMGSAFKDPRNIEFISNNFDYEVKLIKTLNNLKLSNKIDTKYLEGNLLDLCVALGLAIQGVSSGWINTNLLPQEQIRAVELFNKRPYAIATLGCLAISFIVQLCGLHVQTGRINNSFSQHQNLLQNLNDLEKKYNNINSDTQKSKSALEHISSIDSNRFFWMEMLDKLCSLLPSNVTMGSMQSQWVDSNSISTRNVARRQEFFQPKRAETPLKAVTSNKVLLIVINGKSEEPSMGFIEEHILKPIQSLTLFDQKVPAFKNVEIVRDSCRQIDYKDKRGACIIFEIRWIVKTREEILQETQSLTSTPESSAQPAKS
jgi:type IV pilus assembly protein PilM